MRSRFVAAVAAVAFGSTLSASAHAAPGFETGFAESRYQSSDPQVRDAVFARTVDARAGIARVNIVWRAVTGGVPASPSDPADPAYNFAGADAAVSGAVAHGLDPLITIYSAPSFAEGANRDPNAPAGTWRPDPAALGAFARAVATRYSGSFGGLPRVRYFQAWNEPNLDTYLSPQYTGQSAEAPGHYRAMLNAFFDAVRGVHGDNQVVTAGAAPYGDPPGGKRTRPLSFWRDVLCLDRKLKKSCGAKTQFDVFAHHPINTSGGPKRSAINPDDASTPDFGNVVEILRAAERRKTIGTPGKHPAWATELWWDSNPPDDVEGVPLQRQAKYIEQALYILWKQGAAAVIYFQLRDLPFEKDRAFDDTSTGILFADGSPKPSFTAFRFPFVTERKSKQKLTAWGKTPSAGRLVIERKAQGKWRTVRAIQVGEGDVFKRTLKLRGKQKLRAQVGADTSLVWSQR